MRLRNLGISRDEGRVGVVEIRMWYDTLVKRNSYLDEYSKMTGLRKSSRGIG